MISHSNGLHFALLFNTALREQRRHLTALQVGERASLIQHSLSALHLDSVAYYVGKWLNSP